MRVFICVYRSLETKHRCVCTSNCEIRRKVKEGRPESLLRNSLAIQKAGGSVNVLSDLLQSRDQRNL